MEFIVSFEFRTSLLIPKAKNKTIIDVKNIKDVAKIVMETDLFVVIM